MQITAFVVQVGVAFLIPHAVIDAGNGPNVEVSIVGGAPMLGKSLVIECHAHRFSEPLTPVWWKRKGNDKSEPPKQIMEGPGTRLTEIYNSSSNITDIRHQIFQLIINMVSYHDDGFYRCSLTSGKTIIDEIEVEVQGKPVITRDQPMVNALLGYDMQLECKFQARPSVDEVQWIGPEGMINVTENVRFKTNILKTSIGRIAELKISGFSRDDLGNYTCIVKNEKGDDIFEMELSGEPFVKALSSSDQRTVNSGAKTIFKCKAANFPYHQNVEVKWQVQTHWGSERPIENTALTTILSEERAKSWNSGDNTGLMQLSTLTINRTTFNFNGTIVCSTAYDRKQLSDSVELCVMGSPLVNLINDFIGASVGQSAEMTCNVTANPRASVVWYFKEQQFDMYADEKHNIDSRETGVHLTSRLTIYNIANSEFGEYRCKASNRYGEKTGSIYLRQDQVMCGNGMCPVNAVCKKYTGCECVPGFTKTKYGVCKASSSSSSDIYFDVVVISVGVVVFALVLVGASALLIFCWRKRNKLNNSAYAKTRGFHNAMFTSNMACDGNVYDVISIPSDEFPRERLKFKDPLGQGKFGTVVRAEALSINRTGKWEEVAIKMCKESATDMDKEDLFNELVIVRKIPRHLNVVSFYGCCTYGDPVLIIMEYVPGCDLLNYLRKNRPEHLRELKTDGGELIAKDLLSFVLQSGRGMAHLAANNIIHRDVAARNVLIGNKNICKISDFGLARDVEGTDVYERTSKGPLPIRWMAPESLMQETHSHKSDVWSFGILMWEIVTLGASPYSTMSLREVIDAVVAGKRLEQPQHCLDELYDLMLRCWAPSPDLRPTFPEVCQSLEWLLEKEADYIQMDQFEETVCMVLEPDSMDEKL